MFLFLLCFYYLDLINCIYKYKEVFQIRYPLCIVGVGIDIQYFLLKKLPKSSLYEATQLSL